MTMPQSVTTTYLDTARSAADWIRSTAVETEHGLRWKPDPDRPELEATVSPPPSIYSGNAGIVLFLIELAAATGDSTYLDDARRGAGDIAATWRSALATPAQAPFLNAILDFQFGLSGTAFVLLHAARATGEQRFRDEAIEIIAYIVESAHPAGDGVEWIGSPSLGMGEGSITLFLLWAAKELDDSSLRDLATRGGARLIELAQPDPRGGQKWVSPMLENFGAPKGAYAPNFELGTAGIAYVLARLFEETGERRFLDAAQSGAAHIRALATVKNDAALLFYREPDFPDLYYLGYCHGPVGTSRLFYQLHKITGNADDLEWTHKFARGITTSGAPEKQTPGLWYVVCQCCGTAGIFDYFTSLYVATGEPAYLDYARRTADVTIGRETNLDGSGDRWYQAWTRTIPAELTAETGYMIGAAGVGSAFLHLHLAEAAQYRAVLFPDNPFPPAQPAR
jgi:lantibiotic modifying enzyme